MKRGNRPRRSWEKKNKALFVRVRRATSLLLHLGRCGRRLVALVILRFAFVMPSTVFTLGFLY